VDFVRKFGGKIYYGDASRIELLRAAHADQAKVFVMSIDDIESSLKTVDTVKKHFPHLRIIARARNRHHVHLLMDQGVKVSVRETYLSSLKMTEDVLCSLDESLESAQETINKFKNHDEANLIKQHAIHHDESKLIKSVKESAEELEGLFELDK
jgi:glutathione-regulated potassium-efflux system ancillary protein KefC/glutathione-regulated potassium-efflux system protein KefB